MSSKNMKIDSIDGVHKLSVSLWDEVANQIGVVQLVHGMKEYVDRYDDFARYLNKNDLIVIGHDHLGHGDTVLDRDEYGFFSKEDGDKYLVKDVKKITEYIKGAYPDLPIFLLGHSMGSFVTRLTVVQDDYDIAGYICMGTGGKDGSMKLARSLVKLITKVKGKKAKAKFVDKTMGKMFNKNIQNGVPNEWISRDDNVVRDYNADMKSNYNFTNQAYYDLLTMQIESNEPEWFNRFNRELPIFLIAGGEDPVGNYGKGVMSVYDSLVNRGVKDIENKIYPGARHEVLNELNRDEVYGDILQWILERI